jgi:hypothetical protein
MDPGVCQKLSAKIESLTFSYSPKPVFGFWVTFRLSLYSLSLLLTRGLGKRQGPVTEDEVFWYWGQAVLWSFPQNHLTITPPFKKMEDQLLRQMRGAKPHLDLFLLTLSCSTPAASSR